MRSAAARAASALAWHAVDGRPVPAGSPALLAARACPVCDSTRTRPVLVLRDVQFFTDSATTRKRVDVTQQQCLDCFALHLNPAYSRRGFAVLFREAGRSYGATDARPGEQAGWLAERGLLRGGSELLDLGCYDGGFLAALPGDVHRVGVDADAPALARGRRRRPEITFVEGDPERFAYAGAPDVVTMFHVLEHLPRPVAVLRRLRRLVRPGARLVVEVPILERGHTNDVNGFFSVQHMTHFSRASLRACLARGGWAVVEWAEMPGYNGCRVLAAPTTEASVVRGDPDDVAALHACLSSWHGAVAAVERRLAAIADAPRVVVWGAGLHTELLYQLTALFHAVPERRWALVDGDPMKQGRSWRGLRIHPPEALAGSDAGEAPLVVSSYGSQEEIVAAAVRLGAAPARVVRLYADVAVY